MRQPALLFSSILPFLITFVAAKPIYQPRQLERRGIAPLWNESGPHVRDVKQVKTLNCWWAASSLAVLMSSQKWVEQMVRYSNGTSMTGLSWPEDSAVQVTVWNPNSGQQETFTADHNYISQTEDHPNGNWWHDAIGQGARAMGKTDSFAGVISGANPDWDPKSGSATVGLKILTGFDTDAQYTQFLSIDEFFELAQKAAGGTPVIFNTLAEEDIGVTSPQLGHSHDYAIYNGSTDSEGDRVIWARNSWGSTDAFKLQDVYDNSYQIIHLRSWNVLGGGPADTTHEAVPETPAANGTDTATPGANATDTSASQPNATATGSNSTATDSPDTGANSTTPSTGAASAASAPAPAGGSAATSEAASQSAAGSASQPVQSGAASSAPAAGAGAPTAPPAAGGGDTPSWTSTLPGSAWTFPVSILPAYRGKN
ncbi:uncharacterized protein I303_104988 [Kwoniella dejecticola CBS 10117]|uniref:Calpain catalytic domain-containing protein n=1 Tax=Kwoniella dejecticola CBS 10117 TaxID=1296121 RepID=A0A1A6A3S3_9TREE|nr:uncharacterized protein I303_05567 [Kwoniella dejecticola CBS 10117]OBR84708.1 hypothetical protein I303_05567 [Kwoniella dejecticola CBS 10117]